MPCIGRAEVPQGRRPNLRMQVRHSFALVRFAGVPAEVLRPEEVRAGLGDTRV